MVYERNGSNHSVTEDGPQLCYKCEFWYNINISTSAPSVSIRKRNPWIPKIWHTSYPREDLKSGGNKFKSERKKGYEASVTSGLAGFEHCIIKI